MSPQTLFNANLVVVDAMIIINFHELLMLERLINWARGEIIIERRVKSEADRSKAGLINLMPYIQDGSIIEQEIGGEEQENLFCHYFNSQIGKTTIHEGDAACLALAISKGYGLASDEKAMLFEFKKQHPNKICITSRGIVTRLNELGLIELEEAEDLKKGLLYKC